jgi:hypothetical protein
MYNIGTEKGPFTTGLMVFVSVVQVVGYLLYVRKVASSDELVRLIQSMTRRVGIGWLFAFTVATTAMFAIADALDGPTKLARAIVVTDGRCEAGPLVAKSSDTVYLGDGRNHAIVSLPSTGTSQLFVERQSVDVARSTVGPVSCPRFVRGASSLTSSDSGGSPSGGAPIWAANGHDRRSRWVGRRAERGSDHSPGRPRGARAGPHP